MKNFRTALLLAILSLVPLFIASAAGPSIVIQGQRYSLAEDLVGDDTLVADFARPDSIDVSPDGNFAVAVHLDKVDTKKYAPTARLLLLDLKNKVALRELWAWRMATIAGSWQKSGRYMILGDVPNGYDERLDRDLVPLGNDKNREQFLYDPKTGLIDGKY